MVVAQREVQHIQRQTYKVHRVDAGHPRDPEGGTRSSQRSVGCDVCVGQNKSREYEETIYPVPTRMDKLQPSRRQWSGGSRRTARGIPPDERRPIVIEDNGQSGKKAQAGEGSQLSALCTPASGGRLCRVLHGPWHLHDVPPFASASVDASVGRLCWLRVGRVRLAAGNKQR